MGRRLARTTLAVALLALAGTGVAPAEESIVEAIKSGDRAAAKEMIEQLDDRDGD